MARQLILFACLAAVVFSAVQNCLPVGPAIGGSCPLKDYTVKSGMCMKCTNGAPKGCTTYGPAIGGLCPDVTMSIQFGLGSSVDPYNVGICTKC